MIELKSITVERDDVYYADRTSFARFIYPENKPDKIINIELSAPFNFDVYEFHRKFQKMLDMENRKLHRQQLRSGEFECDFTIPRTDLYNIRKIYHNEEKKTTVVCFYHSIQTLFCIDTEKPEAEKIKVKRDTEDHDDIYMAVASAVMIRKYKSNSQFKAHIRRSMPKGFDGRPDVYQMMAAAEVSDIYGSWEKFCKIVDEKLEVYHAKRKKTITR